MASVESPIQVRDIDRERSDTRRITFRIHNSADTAIDISAWTSFIFTIDTLRKPPDNTTQVGQLTGTLTNDGTDGLVYFVPTGSEPTGKYYYAVRAVDQNSEKTTFVKGKYVVGEDRTNT